MLEGIDVTRRLVKEGIEAPRFAIRDGAQDTARRSTSAGSPTAYPFTLMVPQSTTERLLLDRVRELGGDVVRPKVLTTVTQDDDGVTATFDDGDTVRARYVVGADGMHSTVREQAGIGFSGGAYEHSFVLADVRLTRRRPDRRGPPVLGERGPDRRRTAARRHLPHRRARRRRTRGTRRSAFVQRSSTPAGPAASPSPTSSGARGSAIHHRVADTYRAGRILLAGDAAHVHSPAGGQGMNLGIQDAVALADALAAVLGGGPDSLLDDYAPPAGRSPSR